MSFASREYWNTRFTNNPSSFDWLVPAQTLVDIATEYLDERPSPSAQILHIGCGTSDDFPLRTLVRAADQVHNVDFAEVAVEAGAQREEELARRTEAQQNDHGGSSSYVDAGAQNAEVISSSAVFAESGQEPISPPTPSITLSASPSRMRWTTLDLLSLPSILGLLSRHAMQYDLILDKSTSDSISMGAAARVSLPYALSENGWTRAALNATRLTNEHHTVHPLHILAVHLAALTPPRTGRWIAVSYSPDRFPFLPPYPATEAHGRLAEEARKAGFPHPGELWRLERRSEIQVREEGVLGGKAAYVHRPTVCHWLYVLVRTDKVVM